MLMLFFFCIFLQEIMKSDAFSLNYIILQYILRPVDIFLRSYHDQRFTVCFVSFFGKWITLKIQV